MVLLIVLLILMVLVSFWAVMTPLLLRAAIGLALASAILTIIMYQLGAPLAAVFELSVCGGLISVVFVSIISLTHRLPLKEFLKRRESRVQRFLWLPILLLVCAWLMFMLYQPFSLPWPEPDLTNDVRGMLWNLRRLDLFGQILVLLAGVFGVLVLFRGSSKNGN